MTLGEIMRDVTPPEMWQREEGTFKDWLVIANSKSGRSQIFETTVYNDEQSKHLDFVLRSARNFAPLVKALERVKHYGEGVGQLDHIIAEANAALAEALRKEP